MCRDNSIEYLKQKGDDSRALLKDNFEKLRSPEGKLHAFVELVKNHPELELCFRGNSDERIIIYYNNHKIFEVKYTGLTTISFNHARYCKNWKYFLSALKTKGFKVKNENDFDEYKKNGEYDINYIKKEYKGDEQVNKEEIENLYTTILKPIFDCYFKKIDDYKNDSKNQPRDYFKNKDGKPNILIEKIRQHELYSALTYGSNNYFLYDLEFQQKNAGGGNKPDMLAVKFNNGKPEKLFLVEVKCTKASLNGTSSLGTHIDGMKDYIKDDVKIMDRKNEACDILNQYAQLNLRGLTPDYIFKKDDFADLDFGIMLIVTDDAKDSKKIKDLMITKQNLPAYPAADVYIY